MHKKFIRLSIWTSSREPDRRLYLALGDGLDREPGKVCAKKEREMGFFGTDFSIIANIITNFGPDSRIDRSGGNFIRGFSMKTYPDFYSPNIIPALAT